MTTRTADVIAFDEIALEAWRKRLDSKRGNAVESILGFAAECYAFQQDCQRKQGGTTYKTMMMDWFGIAQSVSSKWSVLGAQQSKLIVMTISSLPPQMETLYELCDVPPEVIAKEVTPSTTQRQARELKKRHAPAKPKQFKIGWHRLLSERLNIEHALMSGSDRSEIRARLVAAGIDVPKYITDPKQADAFVNDYVRVIGLKAPELQEIEKATTQTRADLNATQQKKLDAAIRAEHARLSAKLHNEVERRVAEKVASRMRALDALEDEVKEAQAQVKAARATIDNYMTADEYKLILNCLHPDRAPEDRRERFATAFVIFKRLEVYVNHHLPLAVLRERGWAK